MRQVGSRRPGEAVGGETSRCPGDAGLEFEVPPLQYLATAVKAMTSTVANRLDARMGSVGAAEDTAAGIGGVIADEKGDHFATGYQMRRIRVVAVQGTVKLGVACHACRPVRCRQAGDHETARDPIYEEASDPRSRHEPSTSYCH